MKGYSNLKNFDFFCKTQGAQWSNAMFLVRMRGAYFPVK